VSFSFGISHLFPQLPTFLSVSSPTSAADAQHKGMNIFMFRRHYEMIK
jgi:hypothetical protein